MFITLKDLSLDTEGWKQTEQNTTAVLKVPLLLQLKVPQTLFFTVLYIVVYSTDQEWNCNSIDITSQDIKLIFYSSAEEEGEEKRSNTTSDCRDPLPPSKFFVLHFTVF